MSPSQRTVNPPPEGNAYAVGYYHQPFGCHPTPLRIPKGLEQIEIVTEGRGWVEVEDVRHIELSPGTLLWHVEGDHTIGRSDFKNPYRCLSLRFHSPGRVSARGHLPHVSRWEDIAAVHQFAREVIGWYTSAALNQGIVLDYILARLRLQIELHAHRQTDEHLPPPLLRALAYIAANQAKVVVLPDIARAAQCSVPLLHKIFRRHLQKSPHQWLVERRMAAARAHLATTNWPVKRVAAECGFYSAAAFCAQFKRHAGISPATYRRQATYK